MSIACPYMAAARGEPAIPLGGRRVEEAPTVFVAGAVEAYGGDLSVLTKPPARDMRDNMAIRVT
jgi:hypothetical protein